MPSSLDTTLRHLARQQEEDAATQLATRLGLSYASLDDYPFSLETLLLIPLETVKEHQVAAYLRTAERVKLAVVHPEEGSVQALVRQIHDSWQVPLELTVVSPSSLRSLTENYARLLQEKAALERQQRQQDAVLDQKNYLKHVKTLGDLEKEIARASTTEIIDVLLAAALNQDASDVHLEPGNDGCTVRFRIDGVLQPVLTIPMTNYTGIVSRVKMLAGIRLDEHQASQDGRFSLTDRGVNADLRVSIVPTGYGEGIVMRILRQDQRILQLKELGFTDHNRELIERAIRKPYGLILVTGPTGSGKSTTLYAILQALNSPEKKIITLEDPIEYRIPGIQQSQIDPEHQYTFAEGLRGILRQDPDVIMVGEIRDAETATIALNASLTGHLVLSTLHTNDAVAAHTRFLEMGIAPFLISGSIQAIVAQRLVRQLVPGSTPEAPQYKGRLVIAEVLIPNQEFEQAVLQRKDQMTLQEIAIDGGMVTIRDDGLAKVKAGVTTESEVSRVTEVV